MFKIHHGIYGGMLLLLGTCLLGGCARPAKLSHAPYKLLSEERMSKIIGGAGCRGCRYAGGRIDECYHYAYADDCDTEQCIANYTIESTCDPLQGTCNAIQDWNSIGLVQYLRQDVGCLTLNEWDWDVWFTHYYGSNCATNTPVTRCEKFNGSCDGTLLDVSSWSPAIICK